MTEIAISCDQLVFQDDSLEIVKQLCLIFPEAEIYTLAHRPGIDSSVIEQHKIHSSFLSHLVLSEDDYWKKSYLIPSAAKKIFIPCKKKLIFNVSSGFSHRFKRCKEGTLVTYLYDEKFQLRETKSLREKIFRGYLKNWSYQGLDNIEYLMAPNQYSAQSIESKVSKVVSPPVKVSDFPMFSPEQKKILRNNKLLVDASSMDLLQAKEIAALLKELNENFLFVGDQNHLISLKEKIGDQYFFSSQCSGELAPLFAGSKALIVGKQKTFNTLAIKQLAVGSPLICFRGYFGEHYLDSKSLDGLFEVAGLEDLKEVLKKLNHEFDGQKLRAVAMKFHDIKWNAEIKRVADSFIQ